MNQPEDRPGRCLASCEVVPDVLKRCQFDRHEEGSHRWLEAIRADGRLLVEWDGVQHTGRSVELGRVEPPMCEYCNQEKPIMYGWHGDVWCASCMADYAGTALPLAVPIEQAPVGRPAWFSDSSRDWEAYSTPYVITPAEW